MSTTVLITFIVLGLLPQFCVGVPNSGIKVVEGFRITDFTFTALDKTDNFFANLTQNLHCYFEISVTESQYYQKVYPKHFI